MTGPDNAATCHWRTATRLMPTPYWFEAGVRPWSCLRDDTPRPLSMSELRQCATCPHWQPRTFEASKRDLLFEVWGGVPVKEHRTFDEVRRDWVFETWGVS
jgi:hypothetical protein